MLFARSCTCASASDTHGPCLHSTLFQSKAPFCNAVNAVLKVLALSLPRGIGDCATQWDPIVPIGRGGGGSACQGG